MVIISMNNRTEGKTMQAALSTAALPAIHPGMNSGLPLPAGTVDSHTLLQGQKAVTIVHNGAVYRLQATKLGKLILTK